MFFSRFAAGFLLLAAVGCSKNRSPEHGKTLLDWNKSTLVDAFDKVGEHDPAWDKSARSAIADFAELRSGSARNFAVWEKSIAVSAQEAVDAGCKDPLVRYLHTRYVVGEAKSANKATAAIYREVADSMRNTQYPEIRKFYAALRASIALAASDKKTPPETHQYRREAAQSLSVVLADAGTPLKEVEDASYELLEATDRNSKLFKECYEMIEKPLFLKWGNSSSALLIKARYNYGSAWDARGSGFANTVSDEGWKAFGERMSLAEENLKNAWRIDTNNVRIPNLMISVAMAQSRERLEMEIWFQRAMNVSSNNYEAASSKLFYLNPKWHGSPEEMIAFGRECVASPRWGGRVPLILLDAHDQLSTYVDHADRTSYWKQPGVWDDIKLSFERFFELHPDATAWRHNYAYYAYQCEAWGDLNKQLPLLGRVNHAYFGGEAEFNKMVDLARQHAAKK